MRPRRRMGGLSWDDRASAAITSQHLAPRHFSTHACPEHASITISKPRHIRSGCLLDVTSPPLPTFRLPPSHYGLPIPSVRHTAVQQQLSSIHALFRPSNLLVPFFWQDLFPWTCPPTSALRSDLRPACMHACLFVCPFLFPTRGGEGHFYNKKREKLTINFFRRNDYVYAGTSRQHKGSAWKQFVSSKSLEVLARPLPIHGLCVCKGVRRTKQTDKERISSPPFLHLPCLGHT